MTFVNWWSSKAYERKLRNEFQELIVIKECDIFLIWLCWFDIKQTDDLCYLILRYQKRICIILLEHFCDFCLTDLSDFLFHIIKIFLSFITICLVLISLEHKFPNLTIFFHKCLDHFSVSVFFLRYINQLNLIL